jgi:2-polyprenyl-3-methyl-5-hydroxy-6-metoxy-1,4-benzoquinol methylase
MISEENDLMINSTIHYTYCPVCASASITPVLRAKDYTVSGEDFSIWECRDCTLRFTQDAPSLNAIGRYYKSEDYISHTNTSRGLINKLYQAVRKRTLKQKRQLVCKTTGKKQGSLLDVGSGTGSFVKEMKDHGWQVTGLEPDADARQVAKEHFDCELQDSDKLFSLAPDSFDAITLWHVLEHVHDLTGYMQQLKLLLKSDGRFMVAVPNYTSLDAANYKEYWAAYDVPRHLYHFSPQSMQILMENMGMKILEYKPMWFDSFYVSLLSSKYKHQTREWVSALWTGMRSNLSALSDREKCSSMIYIISLK